MPSIRCLDLVVISTWSPATNACKFSGFTKCRLLLLLLLWCFDLLWCCELLWLLLFLLLLPLNRLFCLFLCRWLWLLFLFQWNLCQGLPLFLKTWLCLLVHIVVIIIIIIISCWSILSGFITWYKCSSVSIKITIVISWW